MVEFFHAMYDYTPYLLALAILLFSLSIVLTSNVSQKENTTMLKPTTQPTTQDIAMLAPTLAAIESQGLYVLFAASLATSKDSLGTKALWNNNNPQLVTLKNCAKWAWENLGNYAPIAIIHLGKHIQENQETYGAKADASDIDSSGKPKYKSSIGFWYQKSHANEIHSMFATLGYRPNALVVPTPTPQVLPVQAPSVTPTPNAHFSNDAYPKHLECAGIVYRLSTKPMKKDGSIIYVGGDANNVVTKGTRFSDNGNNYLITEVTHGGKNMSVKLDMTPHVVTPTPSVASHVKPMVTQAPTSSVTPQASNDVMMLLVQSLQAINQRLDNAGL